MIEAIGAYLQMQPTEVNFFLNAGLAGLFATFAIVLFDKFIKYLDRQSDKQDAFLAAQTNIWQEFLKSLTQATNETLIKLGDAHNAAVIRLADEVRNIAGMVAANRTIMERLDTNIVAHDVRVSEALPDMVKAVERLDIVEKENALPGSKEKSRPRRLIEVDKSGD